MRDDVPFKDGENIDDRFQIKRLIGKGGMGAVYEAVDTVMGDEVVVLKTMLVKYQRDRQLLDRFKREAQFARQIHHPNVCRTHEFFESRRGVPFVKMDYVRGRTLDSWLKEKGRPLTAEEAVPLACQLADGLDAVHQAGIVHRDFKASNVLLVKERDGLKPVITDFGLAHPARRNAVESITRLTETGKLIGTVDTMPPEQMTRGDAEPTADIYAFGVVLYRMLTGGSPFRADGDLALIAAKLRDEPIPPDTYVASLRGDWSAFLLKCLARDPAQRFQNVADMVLAMPGARRFPSDKADVVFTPPPQAGQDRGHFEPLMHILDRGFKTIVMCGAPGTGKSELVNGFRRAAFESPNLHVYPAATSHPVGGTPPDHVWWTMLAGARERHVLIDPSGEFFRRLSPQFRDRFDVDLTSAHFEFIRQSIRQLAALVLVVDLTRKRLDDSDAPWRDQENDYRFLLPALRWLRFERADKQPTAGLAAAIQNRSERMPKIDVPILVAFTKADLLDSITNELPLDFARRRLPVLHRAVLTHARRYHYDFCHTMMRRDGQDLPAESPCGVHLSLAWLLQPPYRWLPRLATNGDAIH